MKKSPPGHIKQKWPKLTYSKKVNYRKNTGNVAQSVTFTEEDSSK